jgi:hypothetical protein
MNHLKKLAASVPFTDSAETETISNEISILIDLE